MANRCSSAEEVKSESDSDVLVIDMGEEDEKPPVPPKLPSKAFDQVENALEAMFAEDTAPIHKVAGVDAVPAKEDKKGDARKNAPGRRSIQAAPKRRGPKRKSAPAVIEDTNTGKGKLSLATKKKIGPSRAQDALLDKYKGPFVRVIGDPVSPTWTGVINSSVDPLSRTEDAHLSTILESKVRAAGFGCQSTTLSSKYDSKNMDEAWKCIFCKRPSHFQGLGDLFGPYLASREVVGSCMLRSPSKKADLASKFILGGDQTGRKRKRKASSSDAPPPSAPPTSGAPADMVEVWFHEDCVCWMPCIRLVGHHLIGLDEAIRTSHRELCSHCHGQGSTLGCYWPGCRETAHFCCAHTAHWTINSDRMVARCYRHQQSS